MTDLDPFFRDICKGYEHILLAGDFNINLLDINTREVYGEFFDKMIGNSLFPKITLPTRISNTSCTLIDNIFCKLSNLSLKYRAGIIFSELSDHFPYFVSISTDKKDHKKHKYIKQTTFNESKRSFYNELENNSTIHSLNRGICFNPDMNYNVFDDEMDKCKANNFPTKMVKFNKYKHKKSKWITNGILKSLKFRDRLYLELKTLPINTTK